MGPLKVSIIVPRKQGKRYFGWSWSKVEVCADDPPHACVGTLFELHLGWWLIHLYWGS